MKDGLFKFSADAKKVYAGACSMAKTLEYIINDTDASEAVKRIARRSLDYWEANLALIDQADFKGPADTRAPDKS